MEIKHGQGQSTHTVAQWRAFRLPRAGDGEGGKCSLFIAPLFIIQ